MATTNPSPATLPTEVVKVERALSKAITTLEGRLVVISDVVLGASAAIDPSVLPARYAAILVTVQHVALLVQRGAIKLKALS